MGTFLITLVVFLFIMFIMAIGVIVSNIRIQGSCGGAKGCELCFFKNKKRCSKTKDHDHSHEH